MIDLLISASSLGYSIYIDDESLKGALEKNSNHTLHYLKNISPYIIIEGKMHYVYLNGKKNTKFKTFSNNKYR